MWRKDQPLNISYLFHTPHLPRKARARGLKANPVSLNKDPKYDAKIFPGEETPHEQEA